MVAGLTGAILCIGRVTVLKRVSCHILPYSAIFCQVLPTTAMCGQCAAMCGNMPSVATRSVLPYSARLLPYSARVGLYGVGGMWWEQVVVRKVSRGGPVTLIVGYRSSS